MEWSVALKLGYPHPDYLKSSLTNRQYNELFEYLKQSSWHTLDEWRDNALAYLCYATTAPHTKGGVKLESFKPPYKRKKPITPQSQEQLEAQIIASFTPLIKKRNETKR